MLQVLDKEATEEQNCSPDSSEKAPSVKLKRKQNRLARAVLRAKTVWTTMARRKLDFDSCHMHGNAYVQL
jgi:hypothetical protein